MVEALGHDSYLVWMDRSGHISKRNRRFLRIIRLFKDILLDLGKGQMGQHRSESPNAVSDTMKPGSNNVAATDASTPGLGMCKVKQVCFIHLWRCLDRYWGRHNMHLHGRKQGAILEQTRVKYW